MQNPDMAKPAFEPVCQYLPCPMPITSLSCSLPSPMCSLGLLVVAEHSWLWMGVCDLLQGDCYSWPEYWFLSSVIYLGDPLMIIMITNYDLLPECPRNIFLLYIATPSITVNEPWNLLWLETLSGIHLDCSREFIHFLVSFYSLLDLLKRYCSHPCIIGLLSVN